VRLSSTYVLNATARLVFRLGRYNHVSDALATLHWLRLPQHVDFKVAVTEFRVLHGLALPYLNDLVRVADFLVIITSTAYFIIPAYNRRSTHISIRRIAPLELAAI